MIHPEWLNRELYPFDSNIMNCPNGQIHYVDEGKGDKAIVMVHGTPTWSFMYRHLISGLRDNYRVIAPDNLGFGLSQKPENYSYKPKEQAKNFANFLDQLKLDEFVLMVHDFGGPIGLSYAIQRPQSVSAIIMFNTWMWSLRDSLRIRIIGNFLGSSIGKYLYERFGLSENVIMPNAIGSEFDLTPEIHAHYKHPLEHSEGRRATSVYAHELLASSSWYNHLWQERDALSQIPTLLLWGLQDPAFDTDDLHRWQNVFDESTSITFDDVGHFIPEEKGRDLVSLIDSFYDQYLPV